MGKLEEILIFRNKYISNEYPQIIFSLSSKGFTTINKDLKDYLKLLNNNQLLLSLYDINYIFDKEVIENILKKETQLFLDSGIYESSNFIDLFEIYNYKYDPLKWDVDLYINTIKNLKITDNTNLVNYDIYGSIKDQIEYCTELYSKIKFKVLLIHAPKGQWEHGDIFELVDLLYKSKCQFNILGITERELGYLYETRISNLFTLRSKLNDTFKSYIPIHVFGCNDPKGIVYYSISGADIFDGLNWLRYYFNNVSSYYKNEFYLDVGLGNTLDYNIFEHNIRYLDILKNEIIYLLNSQNYIGYTDEVGIVKKIIGDS